MVKLFHLSLLYKRDDAKVRCLCSASDVSSFGYFQRSSIAEFLRFTCKTVVDRSKVNGRTSVKEGEYVCHTFIRADRLAGVLVSDQEYPQRVAHSLLARILELFIQTVPMYQWSNCKKENQCQTVFASNLESYLATYQTPTQADAMSRIQADLEETTTILTSTLTSLLERGEKLDSLVAKSEELSLHSKVFYKTARKTNQCCQLY